MKINKLIEEIEIKGKIIILYDYTNDKCKSYGEVKGIIKGEIEFNGDAIFTNCLTFFNIDKLTRYGYEVTIRRRDGKCINLSYLLANKQDSSGRQLYTNKEIRTAHNVYRLFIAGALEFESLT